MIGYYLNPETTGLQWGGFYIIHLKNNWVDQNLSGIYIFEFLEKFYNSNIR